MSIISMLYFTVDAVILTLMNKSKFVELHSKSQKSAVVGQICKFCKSWDNWEKFTAWLTTASVSVRLRDFMLSRTFPSDARKILFHV